VAKAAHAGDEHHGRRAEPRQVDRVMSGAADDRLLSIAQRIHGLLHRRHAVSVERPRKESHGERAERGHGAEQFVVGRKEQRAEHQRGGGDLDVKVVPLDHRANEGSICRTARLGRSGRLHGGTPLVIFLAGEKRQIRGALAAPVWG